MASTFTTNLGVEKPGTGDKAGTWGTMTNTNMDLIDEATNGVVSITLSATGSSGSPNDLPITNGASSNGRNKYIEFVDGGDIGGDVFVQLSPNDAEKVVFVRNSLSGSRSIFIFQGTYNTGRDVELLNGKDYILKFPGGGSSSTVINVLNNPVISNDLTIGDDLSLTSDGAIINMGADGDVTITHVADSGITLSAGANATQLNLSSTDAGASVGPTLNLVRDSASPADDDQLGYINFVGDDSGGNQTSYSQIFAVSKDVTGGSEDGELDFNAMVAGTATTIMQVGSSTTGNKHVLPGADSSVYLGADSNYVDTGEGINKWVRVHADRVVCGTGTTTTATGAGLVVMSAGAGAEYGIVVKTGATTLVGISFETSGGGVGSIQSTTTTTTYNTTSDYRLKENVTDMTGAITRVKNLKPKRFNFKIDSTTVDGFLAHEAAEVVPKAVNGEKDAVKEDGSIDAQQIDHSVMIPLLTGALQEAIAKIEVLESKVEALEAK